MLGAKKAYTIGGKEAIPGDLESDSGADPPPSNPAGIW